MCHSWGPGSYYYVLLLNALRYYVLLLCTTRRQRSRLEGCGKRAARCARTCYFFLASQISLEISGNRFFSSVTDFRTNFRKPGPAPSRSRPLATTAIDPARSHCLARPLPPVREHASSSPKTALSRPIPGHFFLSRAARGSWNNHHDRTMLTAFANRVTQVGITPDRASCCCMGARLAARLAAAAAARGAASCRASMADVWQL